MDNNSFKKGRIIVFFMSKQLKPNQWLELFDIYETQGIYALWLKYGAYRNINKNSKYLFFKKYKKFLYHNRDMKTLISMTGKAPKKCTKSGRPKNENNNAPDNCFVIAFPLKVVANCPLKTSLRLCLYHRSTVG